MAETYEVGSLNYLRWYDIRAKFNIYLFRHSKIIRGGGILMYTHRP
jgi:hypothetical protein